MYNPLFSANRHSNHNIFQVEHTGSVVKDFMDHISGLGLHRLDFELYKTTEEVIFAVEGDWAPVSQMDEEARIGSLAYTLNKLGNAEDAAEFNRCLNAICAEGDALYRQAAAKHYYAEIERQGAGEVLKQMALLAMQLASPDPVEEVAEGDPESAQMIRSVSSSGSRIFDREVRSIERMIRGRRQASRMPHDDHSEWLEHLVSAGASCEEVDDVFDPAEAMDQYSENGAIIVMSAHERTRACGRVDLEITDDDLPEKARHLAGYLCRAYTSGVEIDEIREEINTQLEVIFPVFGGTAEGGWFLSRANAEWQRFTREALESLLEDYSIDFHLTAMRHSQVYRRFWRDIRKAKDTRLVGQAMKDAYTAKESGELTLKHFILLKTVSSLQREWLMNARLSPEAYKLIREIETASSARLRYLSWAFYGTNQPSHPIHQLSSQERSRVWDALKTRKHFFAQRGMALVMALYLITQSEALIDILKLALPSSRLPKRPAFHSGRDQRVQVTVRHVHQGDLHRRRA